MIKTVLETEDNSKFTLVYGNKNDESVIFKSELENLETSVTYLLHDKFLRGSDSKCK